MNCKRQRITEMSDEEFESICLRVDFHLTQILKERTSDIQDLKDYLAKLEDKYTDCSEYHVPEIRKLFGKPPSQVNLLRLCVKYIIMLLNPDLDAYRRQWDRFTRVDFTGCIKASTLLMVFATMNPDNMKTTEPRISKILESDMGGNYARVLIPLDDTMFVQKKHLLLLHDAMTRTSGGNGIFVLGKIEENMRETAEFLHSDDVEFMKKINTDVYDIDIM